jgi:hypothetical protein
MTLRPRFPGLLLALILAAMPSRAVDTTAQGEIGRKLTLLAFADDGGRALLLERSGFGPFNEAVWIVDGSGVVEVLPLGLRGPTRGAGVALRAGPKDRDLCRASAERLADLAADFDQISVRVGACASPSSPVVTPMKTWAPVVPSADIGRLHEQVGFAGRTFVATRAPSRDVGVLVVVIGQDLFGNDRVGVALDKK